MKKTFQAIFITLIFILASFQSAYAIGDTFTYDANGNMVQGPGGLYYEYNDANQLKRVKDGGATGPIIAEYWYDHTGKRIKKNESGVVTYYWSGSFEQTVYPNGTVVNTTYYFANGERLAKKVSTDSGSKMYYFHPDHLGSTSVVSNESGQLVEETEYYPYGSTNEGGSEQYLFTSKELDKATGLYYYGARYYNPELTRFVQADPLIPDPYNPQALNRYAYVLNNPLKYTDPSGNDPEHMALGALMIVGGVAAAFAIPVTGGMSAAVYAMIATGGIAGGQLVLTVGALDTVVNTEDTKEAQEVAVDVAKVANPVSLSVAIADVVIGDDPVFDKAGTVTNAMLFGTGAGSLAGAGGIFEKGLALKTTVDAMSNEAQKLDSHFSPTSGGTQGGQTSGQVCHVTSENTPQPDEEDNR